MISCLHPAFSVWHIGVLLSIVILIFGGCGSSVPVQKSPAIDEDLERFNRAAQQAFDKGRLQQAVNLYRKALDRAYIGDDHRSVADAQYNMAICLINLQSYAAAFEVIQQAKTEMAMAGQSRAVDFLLLEATILYLKENPAEAWKITDQILSATPRASSIIQSKTHFLRGLIASKQGNTDKLREAIASLGQSNLPQLRADRYELLGHLAMAEQHWDEAIDAFEEATGLRREVRDYRAMVKTLALAGKASEKAGHANEASVRYLRAGRSAALQGQFDQALNWLGRAEQIAESAGEEQIVQEARIYLRELQESKAASQSRSNK
ncbi:MAG: tetratricopeptide repeat protein [Desulfobacterales bacterium]|jgi:tetratricopeptide (TPR) repeat protein